MEQYSKCGSTYALYKVIITFEGTKCFIPRNAAILACASLSVTSTCGLQDSFLSHVRPNNFKSRLHLNGLILDCVDIMFSDLPSVICLGIGCINFHVVIGEALSQLHNRYLDLEWIQEQQEIRELHTLLHHRHREEAKKTQ